MKIFCDTQRLILRELLPTDAPGMFELDSDPEVLRFLDAKPFERLEQSAEIIEIVRKQYAENGIGRWAVIEKNTNEFLGWAGLKFITKKTNNHVNFYDVGYRLLRKHWGKGFATEACLASLKYGFEEMSLHEIFATADSRHTASKNVLKKSGLKYVETFDDGGFDTDWFYIAKPTKELS